MRLDQMNRRGSCRLCGTAVQGLPRHPVGTAGSRASCSCGRSRVARLQIVGRFFGGAAAFMAAAVTPLQADTTYSIRVYGPEGQPVQDRHVSAMLNGEVRDALTDVTGLATLVWQEPSSVPEIPENQGEKSTWGSVKLAYRNPAVRKRFLQEGQVYVSGMGDHWNWTRILPEAIRYDDQDLPIFILPYEYQGVQDVDAALVKQVAGAPPLGNSLMWRNYPQPVDGEIWNGNPGNGIPFNQTQIDSIVSRICDINDKYREFIGGQDLLYWGPGEVSPYENGVWMWIWNTNSANFIYDGETFEVSAAVITYNGPGIVGFNNPWIARHELTRAGLPYSGNSPRPELGVLQVSSHPWTMHDIAVGGALLEFRNSRLDGVVSKMPEYND